ncbi:pentatricopeptide repeat-containing protein At2g39620-like [Selaginella moellendorffii]|uniref:pentatricopeptide repeat-containing protein At2g39620-like n=1 Tax=Selaginella moellendorffii TaxID=88036 RepID=UPI000D1C4C7A|nr:pentatricopeptide repeat-containing protein At2g39620-like [Selaginella moellendorffii]|eukprot:XP_024542906.1 pentatricopeptide repeat-containing protein At2g39620-like [Selaginella moellendorffii]
MHSLRQQNGLLQVERIAAAWSTGERVRLTRVRRAELVAAIKQCGQARDLERGKRVHCAAVAAGFHTNKFVASVLITMYGRCRSVALAREVFDAMIHRDLVAWNSIILAYVDNGNFSSALSLFASMDFEADAFTYVAALKACAGLAREVHLRESLLKRGIAIHERVKQRGLQSNVLVANTLLDMYCKCGSLRGAMQVFEELVPCRNVVTWTCLILGHVESGESLAALDLFESMDCQPDSFTYVAALKAIVRLASQSDRVKFCLEKGIAIHKHIKQQGFESDSVVASAVMDMYSKCRSWGSALELFFERMTMRCYEPDSFTCIAALKACGGLASMGSEGSEKLVLLNKGIAIHKQAVEHGFASSLKVASTLVYMYSKCGDMRFAREVFDGMVSRDVQSWTCIILGYVENGDFSMGIELFVRMECDADAFAYAAGLKAYTGLARERESERQLCLREGIEIHRQIRERGFDSDVVVVTSLMDLYSKCGSLERAMELFSSIKCEPDALVFAAALNVCGALADLERGIEIHKKLRDHHHSAVRWESDLNVGNSLINMYMKCGRLEHARRVFEAMIHKNAGTSSLLIQGYVRNGENAAAIDLFMEMNCEADAFACVSVLKACGALASEKGLSLPGNNCLLERGIAIHKRVRDLGYESKLAVASTLVDLYCKCGCMVLAREVFDRMIQRDIVSWNALFLGYVENGEPGIALDLFLLGGLDCEADTFTHVALLKGCGILAALSLGRWIHGRACRLGMERDQVFANALVDFYGNCGEMVAAREVFLGMVSPNVVSWSALIAGYSSLGDVNQVLTLARAMELEAGLEMNGITLISVLTACSHAGLVEEGKLYLAKLVNPSVEHYNCMVDVLGRANHLEEALSLVKSLDGRVNDASWMILLGACKKWNNMEVGKVAFDALVARDTRDAAPFVLISNMWRFENKL